MFYNKNIKLVIGVREKVLNYFKSKIFPIKNLKDIPTPEIASKVNHLICVGFLNILSIIVHLLLKDLLNGTDIKNLKIVNHINGGLINLSNAVNKKNLENENSNKIIDIVEEILNFNKQ